MRIVCLSDIHQLYDEVEVPDGDLLLIAGDIGAEKTSYIPDFSRWLYNLPHKYKLFIAGNHDFAFEQNPSLGKMSFGNKYLFDESIEVEGLKIYGSPYQPWFYDWAFNLLRGEPLRKKWAQIPEDTNILLTHGPPYGIGDMTPRGQLVGCEDLLERIKNGLPHLKLHVFGHIHNGYGVYSGAMIRQGLQFINASICDEVYSPINPPIVIDL